MASSRQSRGRSNYIPACLRNAPVESPAAVPYPGLVLCRWPASRLCAQSGQTLTAFLRCLAPQPAAAQILLYLRGERRYPREMPRQARQAFQERRSHGSGRRRLRREDQRVGQRVDRVICGADLPQRRQVPLQVHEGGSHHPGYAAVCAAKAANVNRGPVRQPRPPTSPVKRDKKVESPTCLVGSGFQPAAGLRPGVLRSVRGTPAKKPAAAKSPTPHRKPTLRSYTLGSKAFCGRIMPSSTLLSHPGAGRGSGWRQDICNGLVTLDCHLSGPD